MLYYGFPDSLIMRPYEITIASGAQISEIYIENKHH